MTLSITKACTYVLLPSIFMASGGIYGTRSALIFAFED